MERLMSVPKIGNLIFIGSARAAVKDQARRVRA